MQNTMHNRESNPDGLTSVQHTTDRSAPSHFYLPIAWLIMHKLRFTLNIYTHTQILASSNIHAEAKILHTRM